MKKLLILLSIISISCSKKEVKIPTLSELGIQEIQNYSEVWMFFQLTDNDTIADINRKNTISTTHWIYNIDKRLPLKSIIPSIIILKYKHANSMHSEKGMHDYFSYSDTISKKLSFIAFDTVEYKTDSLHSKSYIKKNSNEYGAFNNINLTFNEADYWINGNSTDEKDFKSTIIKFININLDDRPTMLHLNFNKEITYQHYLSIKTMVNSLIGNNISISNIEFIFNHTKVLDYRQ